MPFRYNRMEFAGSLGDLGVLLPMGLGLIMVNHLSAQGLFLGVGLFYILAGLYFRITVPVQPMKVIASYSIAMGLGAGEIAAAGLLMGILLLVIGLTGVMTRLASWIPIVVIRGVQLSTGLLLMAQGGRLVVGNSTYQLSAGLAEPYLKHQHLMNIPLNWWLAGIALLIVLLLLNNRKTPASIFALGFGMITGYFLSSGEGGVVPGLYLPQLLPQGIPAISSLMTAMLVLVLPQLPMTLGNAAIANEDLARQYFGSAAEKSTSRALCISMGLANLGAFLLGGMPMCHGAGGLAAHYRFGARTGGSNIIIGAIFILLALVFGDDVVRLVQMVPLSILGVLLLFSGSELALTLLDVRKRNDLFIVVLMVAITLAANLTLGFALGLVLTIFLRWWKIRI